MNDLDRMLSGRLYCQMAIPDLEPGTMAAMQALREFNKSLNPMDPLNMAYLQQAFSTFGDGSMVMAPLRCTFPNHIRIGKHCFINLDCLFFAEGGIDIGDGVDIAPRVSIYTLTHPLPHEQRASNLMLAKKVVIGSGTWICGNTVINPGVTIGEGSVIGAGSVVTRDIPANVFAAGNPCRVIRPITEEEAELWKKEIAEYEADPDTADHKAFEEALLNAVTEAREKRKNVQEGGTILQNRDGAMQDNENKLLKDEQLEDAAGGIPAWMVPVIKEAGAGCTEVLMSQGAEGLYRYVEKKCGPDAWVLGLIPWKP